MSSFDMRYIKRFGMPKSELLDKWLEMNNSSLKEECAKNGLEPSEKHVENIQNLFEYLKEFE